MPKDTMRIQGPEGSQSAYLYREIVQKSESSALEGKRSDGRTAQEIRPIFLKAGPVSQAKGSAYIEMRSTKVICAVYGPREVPRREGFTMSGQLRCDFKFATFSCHVRRGHMTDSTERELGLQVQQALEPAVCLHKIPKSQVDIFITVLENDGSALAAAITCASVAVANAGIEMYDIVIGCAVRQSGEEIIVDPTLEEEYHGCSSKEEGHQASVTAGVLPSLNQVSALVQRGQLQCEDSIKALQQCVEGSQRIYPVVHTCLKNSVKKMKTKASLGSNENTAGPSLPT